MSTITCVSVYQPVGDAAFALRELLPHDPGQARAVSILNMAEELPNQELPLPYDGVTIAFTGDVWAVRT